MLTRVIPNQSVFKQAGTRMLKTPAVQQRVTRAVYAAAATMTNLLVVSSPDSPELEVLDGLPADVKILAVGQTLRDFGSLTDEQWSSIDVLLNCGVGPKAGKGYDIKEFWPRLKNLRWLHSASAGLEHLLFPELIESPVTVTNAKGVYSHSLAEYAMTCCLWFAKDLPRMQRAQRAHRWEKFAVQELRGATLGIVGLGDIGAATARLARAFRFKRIIAVRRRTQLTEQERSENLVDEIYGTDALAAMLPQCDYVVAALPQTPATQRCIDADAIAAMKRGAVFVNVGRGSTVDEPALIEALQQGYLRGAGLDVFETEPLPLESPLWDMDNVLMSAHCADMTTNFQHESLELFVSNMQRFLSGQELLNVCDKKAGY